MDKLTTVNALFFYGVAVASMVMHALKKWAAGEIQGSLIDWYIFAPRRTVGALMLAVGGTMTVILGGQVFDIHDGAHILAVFGIGYASDSAANGTGKRK